MGGAFSYASFSRAKGRAGGWGVGQKVGDLTQEELAELVSFVPTSLNNGTAIPDFPSAQQRAELVRRTAVFALTPEADKWVTMVSVPAGLDATGRGGNVFTYTTVTRTGTPPAPSTVLYSPDVPAPFSIYEVDKVQIPEGIAARGPLHSDVLLDEFLDGEFRQPEKLPAPFKSVTPNPDSTFNRELVSAMATVLNSRNGLVILVVPDNQAALWIAATAREVGEDGFGFSTFERAAAINEFPLSTSTMIVVPPSEKQRLADTAISGNPVVFVLGEALPDVSAYERTSDEKETTTAEPEAPAAQEAAPFGAPSFGSSPFAGGGDPAAPFPPNPLAASHPREEQLSPSDDGLPLNAASDNPFAAGAAGAAMASAGAGPDRETSTSTAPSFTSAEPAPELATATVTPGTQLGSNATVPALSTEEYQKLITFDARWWIEYLDTHRGRSIQLAYLDKSTLGDGLDKLLMSAIIASWVFYFPRDFTLLAEDALRPWENRDLEHIAHLTADHFVNAFHLENCERYATGRVAMVLDAVAQLLAERSVRHQQHHPGWQNRGQGQGRGTGL
ncbi:GAP1-N2 domain-containing protein [Corynebacterium minutissimum]|uniref:GTPase-associated protein 1 N-terminal domain-containing protein n=1 Tax=Corynebacterium minutissimum TaxID=38301 RepID=A0A2X4RV33_9CORY|nr:hypothetical protein [Corynebacterium minutissimum]SQI01052.1 Uncharacterised protein [Corynebacterium minutissimum]VEG04881.1 Uncharacterised protein [Corynebacterium minutissimum]